MIPTDPLAVVPPVRPAVSPPSPRALTLTVSMLVTAVLLTVLAVLPAPYVLDLPGPTTDVLGKVGGTQLITITGAQTYPTTGQLRLVTVSALGTPGYPAFPVDVLDAWLRHDSVATPAETQVAPDTTKDELAQQGAEQMASSQELATVAALTELGYQVPATLTVAQVVEGSGAAGHLQEGDVITGLDATATPDYATLLATLKATTAGATVTVHVTRSGQAVDVPVVTTARDGGGALLGVAIDPTFHPPVTVTFAVDGIGGPSAGTMFALGIIDRLTSDDEANGQVIAGTGTIDALGDVGAIGGIAQKMSGARRDGASWFLAPESNCADVLGHVPAGLHVVEVSTLHEAREDVIAIGAGKGASLPTCTAS